MSTNSDQITILKSVYDDLADSEWKLRCLETWGVDNWSGYDEAMKMYHEGEEEDE